MDIMHLIQVLVDFFTANGAEIVKDVLALVAAVQALVALIVKLLDALKTGQTAVRIFRS